MCLHASTTAITVEDLQRNASWLRTLEVTLVGK